MPTAAIKVQRMDVLDHCIVRPDTLPQPAYLRSRGDDKQGRINVLHPTGVAN